MHNVMNYESREMWERAWPICAITL